MRGLFKIFLNGTSNLLICYRVLLCACRCLRSVSLVVHPILLFLYLVVPVAAVREHYYHLQGLYVYWTYVGCSILVVLSLVVKNGMKGQGRSGKMKEKKKNALITAYLGILDVSDNTGKFEGSSSPSSHLMREVQKSQFQKQQRKILVLEVKELQAHLWEDKFEWEMMTATRDTKMTVAMWLSAGYLQRLGIPFIWRRDVRQEEQYCYVVKPPRGLIVTFIKRDCSVLGVKRRSDLETLCQHRLSTLHCRTIGTCICELDVTKHERPLTSNESLLLSYVYEGAIAHLRKAAAVANWFKVGNDHWESLRTGKHTSPLLNPDSVPQKRRECWLPSPPPTPCNSDPNFVDGRYNYPIKIFKVVYQDMSMYVYVSSDVTVMSILLQIRDAWGVHVESQLLFANEGRSHLSHEQYIHSFDELMRTDTPINLVVSCLKFQVNPTIPDRDHSIGLMITEDCLDYLFNSHGKQFYRHRHDLAHWYSTRSDAIR